MRTKAETDSGGGAAVSGYSAGHPATVLGGGKDPHRDCGSAQRGQHRGVVPQGGINQNLYHRWSKNFLEAGKKRLAGDPGREATADEVKRSRRKHVSSRVPSSAWSDLRDLRHSSAPRCFRKTLGVKTTGKRKKVASRSARTPHQASLLQDRRA